jgi:N-dimethylarginine dimethylaminohydrolase
LPGPEARGLTLYDPDLVHSQTLSEAGHLARVLVKHPRDAFVSSDQAARQWRELNFTAAPELARAAGEFDAFSDILRRGGATVEFLPADPHTTLDSIYVRDAAIVAPGGMVLCRMGKARRGHEPDAQRRWLQSTADAPPIAGAIVAPGTLEGGDVLWLDDRTLAVGRGYRTNAEGIQQLRALVAPEVEVREVPLPHWRGEQDVLHLMSLISPVDHGKALVYSPLLPVPFREWLLDRGFLLVETDPGEFDSMATNVLALAPGRCLMLDGNPRTRAALERAGVEVVVYRGDEISVKGAGGPTCLTRPLSRQR